jgi:hypothetical protein
MRAVLVLPMLLLAVAGCTGGEHSATRPVGSRRIAPQLVRVSDRAGHKPTMSRRQATVVMLNSNMPPPLPEAGTGVVRPVRIRFGSARIVRTVAHSGATRLEFASAWIAEWDDPAGDFSLCPNAKQPPDPAPPGPVHRAFVLSDDGDAATVYQGATIRCGVAHPPSAGPASATVSVPWKVSRRTGRTAVLTFRYPSCGSPAGGEGRGGRWFVLVDVPIGARCAATTSGAQSYIGPVPLPGRTGVVRQTATDPLAPPIPG